MRTILTVAALAFAACTSKGTGTTAGVPPGSLLAGAQCGSNASCSSGHCGSAGSGNCCSQSCASSDATCGATSCDSSGACVYPAEGTSCGASACASDTLSASACDGDGFCDASSGACPGNLACADGQACNTSCSGDGDCALGFVCIGNACIAPVATGACIENQQCKSGICGVKGTGSCCTEACASLTAPCGATSCDAATGACVYPDTGTACGSGVTGCSNDVETTPTFCNGSGACASTGSKDCFPYACGADACQSACTSDGGCQSGAGNFCDVSASACCGGSGGLGAGTSLLVDAVSGSDATACCGFGGATPCRTLAHAMALISQAQVTAVTIHATVDGGGGDWAPVGETYPIALDLGVQLYAPGVFFSDPASHAQIFDVISANGFTASIVGTDSRPVTIGMDSKGSLAADPVTIAIRPTSSLALAAANVFGSAQAENTAIAVGSNASLTLGTALGSRAGTVHIGGAPPAPAGWIGIDCQTGCEVTDGTLAESSVVIAGEESADLQVADGAMVYLTSSPVIGAAPAAVGFRTCVSKTDSSVGNGAAVSLSGAASVIFQNGTVQCIAGAGFSLAAAGSGAPSLNLKNTLIQNTERAIFAPAGTATVSGSTIRFNYEGVVATTDGVHDGLVDLDGTAQATNTVVCSSRLESVDAGAPGVSLFNGTGMTLAAASVAWDTAGPDIFDCDASLTSCSCEGATCVVSPGGDGMDIAVVGAGSVTTTGATVSTTSCGGS